MNRKNKQIVVSLLFLFSFFLFPSMTFAQATPAPAADSGPVCTCFCGTKSGAKKPKSLNDQKVTEKKCESACNSEKPPSQMVVCAKTMRQYPGNNSLCFDKAACEAVKGDMDLFKKFPQPPECPFGWKYCFPITNPSMVKLSTKIGDLETVGDLGVYVSGVYKWMVRVAGFFAIIMVMIGGFQYVLGGAASDQISKAKERMKNGVIGMVLLFCVVLILQTINPQLLKLEVPRPSKIREINLASNNNCEKLLADGHTITPEEGSKTECGGIGEITSGPEGKIFTNGLTCPYTACSTSETKCLLSGNGGSCYECGDIFPDNEFNVKPSSSVCTQLSFAGNGYTWKTSDGRTLVEKCFYTHDPSLIYSGLDVAALAAAGVTLGGSLAINALISDADPEDMIQGTCSEVEFDCKDVDECSDYDEKLAENNRGVGEIDVQLEELFTTPAKLSGEVTLKTICEANPCKVKNKNGGTECYFEENTSPNGDDCENSPQ